MKSGNRSLWKKIVSSPLTMVAVFILAFIMAKATWNIYHKASLSETKLSQAQAEFEKLDERKTDLARRVDYLSTDLGVEAEIRTKYHAVKEGESVAVIIDDSETASVVNATSTVKLSFWVKILKMIGFGKE